LQDILRETADVLDVGALLPRTIRRAKKKKKMTMHHPIMIMSIDSSGLQIV
jgi:hypothetical protein